MNETASLHPFDVILALRLLRPAGTFAQLAEELSVAPSQVHASLARLEFSGLVRPGTRAANRHALAEFLEHGVQYAFPVRVGVEALGVPTAHSAQILANDIAGSDSYVWPAPNIPGAVRGFSVSPLYVGAVNLRDKSPDLYQLVAVVDAVRVGNARERALAKQHLRNAIEPGSGAD